MPPTSTNNKINKRYISSASITADTEGKLTGEGTPIAREGAGGTLTKLWRFEKNEETGKYLIRNANTDRPIGQWTSLGTAINMLPTTTDEQWAGAFTMEQGSFGATTWILKEQGHQLNAFKGDASDMISSWENANDEGGNWYIERVTEIPLAITAAKWASATYPHNIYNPLPDAALPGNTKKGAYPAEIGVRARYNGMELRQVQCLALPWLATASWSLRISSGSPRK